MKDCKLISMQIRSLHSIPTYCTHWWPSKRGSPRRRPPSCGRPARPYFITRRDLYRTRLRETQGGKRQWNAAKLLEPHMIFLMVFFLLLLWLAKKRLVNGGSFFLLQSETKALREWPILLWPFADGKPREIIIWQRTKK